MFLSTHWLLYHLTTIMHHSALHFSFINRICLLSTLQCGLPMAACDDWQAVNIHRFWSFWRECAHLPYLNTRRDSQAVMQDISHPGMIHFVPLSLLTLPRSKSSSVITFFMRWRGADLFFKRMLFWVSGRQASQMPVQQEWEKVYLFSCTITNMILIIISTYRPDTGLNITIGLHLWQWFSSLLN